MWTRLLHFIQNNNPLWASIIKTPPRLCAKKETCCVLLPAFKWCSSLLLLLLSAAALPRRRVVPPPHHHPRLPLLPWRSVAVINTKKDFIIINVDLNEREPRNQKSVTRCSLASSKAPRRWLRSPQSKEDYSPAWRSPSQMMGKTKGLWRSWRLARRSPSTARA